jgi:pentose-5-phosphate-3-epimerase
MNREYHQPRSVLATHVTPAILTDDYRDLVTKLQKISSVVDWVQIDVVDGVYAPNTTWPFVNDEKGMFTSIVRQDEPMPFWDEMNFEIDLMVKNPAFEVDRWIAAGAMRLVVHIDSIELAAFVELAKNIREKGVEMVVGFAINSSYEKLAAYIDAAESAVPGKFASVRDVPNVISGAGKDALSDVVRDAAGKDTAAACDAETAEQQKESGCKVINWVQCMGIEHEGFQHQSFDAKVLEHISKIKEMYPYMFISVDGSVNMNTAQKLIDAGADRLVVGSALFEAESLKESIVQFSNMFGE